MYQGHSRATVIGLIVGILVAAPLGADEPGKARLISPRELRQEIDALHLIYLFNMNPQQLQALQTVAKETAAKPARSPKIKISDDFRKTMTELRDALVQGEDEDRINRLVEKCEDLKKAENVDFQEDVELTEEAVRQAPEVLRLLKPPQVAMYLGSIAEDMPDPVEMLHEALDRIREVESEQRPEVRSQVAEEISQLLGGMDDEKTGQLVNQITQLLIRAGDLNKEQFKAQRADLEKAAHKILANAGPMDILHHVVEHHLAQLLSNPQLVNALELKLKQPPAGH